MKKHVAVLLTLTLITLPLQNSFAKSPSKSVPIQDIALNGAGDLNGKVVSAEGKLIAGGKVSVRKNGKEVANVVTTREGEFAVAGLSTGIYEVQAGQAQGVIRVWEKHVAPPNTKSSLMMVQGEVTRGQAGVLIADGPGTAILIGTTVTSVVLSGITLGKVNDLEDQVDQIPTSP